MKKLTFKVNELGAESLLTRLQLKNIVGGESGSGSFCGTYGTVTNCPSGTTPEKCNALGSGHEAYCKSNSTGLCHAYGTATCNP